jgi:paraquat-inducible protein A
VSAFVIALPLVRFGLLTAVLGAVRLGRCPTWRGRAFRWALHLDHWAMPDVYLIGFAIGYSRVTTNLTVKIGMGGWCLIGAAMLTMLSRAALDRRTVWRAIGPEREPPPEHEGVLACHTCELVLPMAARGSPCPRCRQRLAPRKPDSQVRTAALLIAGLLLYFPANIYPMSIATQLGKEVPHRIVDGIRELFQAGLWPLGVLIFGTSIAIPLLKIVGLGWLVLSVRRRSGRRLQFKTHCHRFIDEIGRWSNVDVFTIAVFVPLIQYGALASARAAWGAPAFMLVVILTMIASRTFDPRLLWDAGLGERA